MSYKRNCNRCNQEILMDESLGKWHALNLDGSGHICKEQQQGPQQQTQAQQKQVQEPKLSLESLDARLKRVENKLFGSN